MKYLLNLNYLKNLKILCVEDDYIIYEQIVSILSPYCDHLLLAKNGKEGLDHYNKNIVDIIITDIRMPLMDGVSMIREIRSINLNIPIILITGYEQNDYLLNCINLGIDGYINKPLDPNLFLDLVGKVSHQIQTENQLKSSIEVISYNKIILEKQKKELELILEGSEACTWSLNLITDEIEVNDKLYLMLGYKKKEINITLQNFYTFIHCDDVNKFKTCIENHVLGITNSIDCELRFNHTTGKIIWTRVHGQVLLRDKNGIASNAFGILTDITKEKKIYSRIIEAEEESNAIIHNFLDILFVVNDNLKIVRINKATCFTLGYQYDEIFMQPVTTLFHNDESTIKNYFTKGIRESIRNIELKCRHKCGDILPMSFNISPLSNDKYHVNGAIAGAKDVSELRFSLNEIEKHKKYIENLITMLPVGLLIVNNSLKFEKANKKYNELINTCSEHLNITNEMLYNKIIDSIKLHLHETNDFNITIKYANSEIYFRCKIGKLFSDLTTKGQFSDQYIITLSNVSHEIITEREKNLLSLAMKKFQSPIYIADSEESIIFANDTAIKGNHSTKKNILNTNLFDSLMNDSQKSILDEIRLSLQENGLWTGNNTYECDNNQFKEEEIFVFIVHGDDSNSDYIVANSKDVTEIVLLQRQLALSQKLEAIGQLASGIAHEINSPIQYVINNLAFIQNSFNELYPLLTEINHSKPAQFSAHIYELSSQIKLDFFLEEIPQSIDEAFEGLSRVATIISALRKFSHPGDGEKVLTDINETLEGALIVCRHEWKYVAELLTEYAHDLPSVPCYPDQINQAFLNLIINAANAIETSKENDPEKQHLITVRTRLQDNYVEISITDTGCGIPKKLYSRIFEPFFTTKSVGKGTGQGLAIVHDIIVKKHEGRIVFTSEEGAGSTFYLYLPISLKDQIQR